MRRQFRQDLLINEWLKPRIKRGSIAKGKYNSPFAIWFKSKMDTLDFERADLIKHGIDSGQLTKWFKCKRYPHPHNVAKVVTAICNQTNSDVNTMLSECLNQIGFYK